MNDDGGCGGRAEHARAAAPTERTWLTSTAHPTDLGRRRDAALRCEPLPWRVPGTGSGLAGRDPWLPRQRHGPSTYALTPAERAAEARRLRRAGWSTEEVLEVLAIGVVAA